MYEKLNETLSKLYDAQVESLWKSLYSRKIRLHSQVENAWRMSGAGPHAAEFMKAVKVFNSEKEAALYLKKYWENMEN